MTTDYNRALFDCARWMADAWRKGGEPFLTDLRTRIERWSLEFQPEGGARDNG